MNDLTPFTNGEFELSITTVKDYGFRVQAPGLARALGFRAAHDLLRNLPVADQGYELVRTPGGEQRIGYVTEAGFYRALGQRQSARITDFAIRDAVERFQTWVYADVLPAIRKTGRFAVAQLDRRALAEMVIAEADRADQAEAKVAELEPAAQAWDELVDTGTTLDVAAAAKKLNENGIPTGQNRLYKYMRAIGWVFKNGTQPMQSAVDAGWLTVDWGKKFTNQKTGEEGQGQAKSRVTAKGLAELQRRMAAVPDLTAAEALLKLVESRPVAS